MSVTKSTLLRRAFGTSNLKGLSAERRAAGQAKLLEWLEAASSDADRLLIWLACRDGDCAPPAAKTFEDLSIRARAEAIEAVETALRTPEDSPGDQA